MLRASQSPLQLSAVNTNQPRRGKQITWAIDLQKVSVLRDGRWILRNVNWQVESGALAAIVGPNGSGKSTLARVISTHWWPTAGTCSVLGEMFGDANLPELRKSIRLVQPAGPYDAERTLSARETIVTGFFGTVGLYQRVTKLMLHRAEELLERVGLRHVAGHSYESLSSGEKVRTLIARAMATLPRLLILDEPTAGLDLRAREQVLATVHALMQSKKRPTVVLITHHIEELSPQTSHVLLLDKGRAAAEGAMEKVLNPKILSRVYGVPVTVRNESGRYYAQVHPSAWRQLLKTTKG
jgi:iron complex transport system ATP-binding protein